ncbi:MAG: peptidoglycan DD-metalloendopeptidase family protein, partial [Mariniphaga sp.]|nr:peptidoglycan DD-metalloendopeptidase family protein [Mariniphaga sp.]
MQKTGITLLFILCIVPGLLAQYKNTDSLILIQGHEEPLSLLEFDALLFVSPEADPYGDQNFLYGQYIPTGIILSRFSLPSSGRVISRFGPRGSRMHSGIDLKMATGDTIYAAYNGTVTRAKYYYGYGNMVVLDHCNNLETSYSHLSGHLVKPGQKVFKNQPVGLAGATGRATTSHLHFEIREGGRAFDPELVFDFENALVRDEVTETYSLTELNTRMNPVRYAQNESVPKNYTVRSGDSLWKISRRFSTTIHALCMLNNL